MSKLRGIWVEQDITNSIPTPHIRIYTKSDKSQLVNYYYGCYDPLQYPLLFPYGQGGWHCGIKKIKCSSKTSTQMGLTWKRSYAKRKAQSETLFLVVNIIVTNFK
ncbi:hypothetical protein H5410_020280 [Solanum commersonii]|uniref:Uncharacterized protein n=1 Tax=Solanum commersonii TaxID=4109 RepID=A0A9J5ZAQ3_SOLCO|nr:hypothetical protein H5410_020280 [Solanum commersonii]